MSAADPAVVKTTYPIEIIVNGGLEFKLDSEDAEGDLRAIKALMTWRAARREHRPLTDTEIYGTDRPHDMTYRSPHGKLHRITQEELAEMEKWSDTFRVAGMRATAGVAPAATDCTFKKGDKGPCPTCPRLITALHRCGLLQDEVAIAESDDPAAEHTLEPTRSKGGVNEPPTSACPPPPKGQG